MELTTKLEAEGAVTFRAPEHETKETDHQEISNSGCKEKDASPSLNPDQDRTSYAAFFPIIFAFSSHVKSFPNRRRMATCTSVYSFSAGARPRFRVGLEAPPGLAPSRVPGAPGAVRLDGEGRPGGDERSGGLVVVGLAGHPEGSRAGVRGPRAPHQCPG